MREKIRDFYSLTKPGVTYGNAISAVAGFLFAARGAIEFWPFVAFTVGITLIIASACVLNNYFDQDIDRLMTRTKKRAIVAGKVKGSHAVIFSTVLGLVSLPLLLSSNLLTMLVGIFGFLTYVFLYGMFSKRLSIHGTLVGSISGAAPILAGYTAVTGVIDVPALLIFGVLFFWQMPEFYSIAIYRRKEYAAANVPVMTVVKGVKSTKWQILVYTILFTAAAIGLFFGGWAGVVYGVFMTLLCAYWLMLAVRGVRTSDDDAWARRMFRFSLVILLAFCGLISIDALLP